MARTKKGLKIDGWLNLYKPKGMGSTEAVGKIRWLFKAQKAGHAGTLDPLAEGILPIALGEATKTIPYIQDTKKTYRFEVIWGSATTTDDQEGAVIETSDHRPNEQDILAILPQFTGEIEQYPPQFSAVKIDGERAYDLARKGEIVDIKPRIVCIDTITLLDHKNDVSTFEIHCGKGTYIRSFGRDIGKALGSCAHIRTLIRTQVGGFDESNAFFLDKLEEMVHKGASLEALLPVDSGLDDILVLELTEKEAIALRQGQKLSFVSRADFQRLEALNGSKIARAYVMDDLIGLVEIDKIHINPMRIFNL